MLSLKLWIFIETVWYYINVYWVLTLENKQRLTYKPIGIWRHLYITLTFILYSVLFLTINYICQTVYCKV